MIAATPFRLLDLCCLTTRPRQMSLIGILAISAGNMMVKAIRAPGLSRLGIAMNSPFPLILLVFPFTDFVRPPTPFQRI
jgi:hypothetical protein